MQSVYSAAPADWASQLFAHSLVSYPGHSWRGGLIPLQRYSQCILQPQPTGQYGREFRMKCGRLSLKSKSRCSLMTLYSEWCRMFSLSVTKMLAHTAGGCSLSQLGNGCSRMYPYMPSRKNR